MQLLSITPAYGVASLVASTVPVSLVNLQGYFRGATADRWLQIHDAAALPANGAVPLKSYALPQQMPFSWSFDPTPLPTGTGLVIAISTTEGTLTISTDVADIFVDVAFYYQPVAGLTTVGDLVTGVIGLQVWLNAAGPKKLFTATAVNPTGTDAYLMLFALDLVADSLSPGFYPMYEWFLAKNSTLNLYFGNDGINVQNVDPQTTAGSLLTRKGCSLIVSATARSFTEPANTDYYIKATYK